MTLALLRNNPLRILNEVCAKCGTLPKFELLQIEGEHHSPIFSYKVTVDGMTAVGTGRSKQKARNSAAEAMLRKMMNDPERKGYYIDANSEEIGEVKNEALTFDEQEEISGNPVGGLQELCASRRWPPPYYALVGEDPPQNRLFTITCYVLGLTETGIGSSKKKAKKMAAQRMCDKLDEMLFATVHSGPGLDELGQRLKDLELHYSSLKENKVSTLTGSLSEEICQFYRDMGKEKGEKLIGLQRIPFNSLDFNSVQYLQEIAAEQHFEVTYVDINEKSFCGDFQCLVQISSLPVAVCYGQGATSKEAQFSAAHCALEYLKIITKS
ncbi:protein Loquacious [Anabrus simplex]|uniref:protein Loquacious n=1 Tax=Anabrus simplex TaxID=316456 RepID=UPI0034DCF268